jgi:alpha/beta superfamily hydrolase
LLLVHGECDEFGDVERVRQLAAQVADKTEVQLVVVPGAGHFFENHLDDLKRAISEWISEQLAA